MKTGLAVVLLSAATATQAHAQMRFQGMDRNRDGVITRNEWRGNDTSFRNEDWNGDGVLSGDEVRPGARKPAYVGRDWNHDGVVDQQDALIGQRFNGYDRNGDGRITADEWRAASADSGLFYRLDTNRDRALTPDEYAASNLAGTNAQGGPPYQFANIDRNRDGWITRNEWDMGDTDFNRLDTNRDNRISQYEFQSYSNTNSPYLQPNGRFTALDTNRDGLITWNEWRGTEGDYVRLDTNGDARINPSEFDANPTAPSRFAVLDANRDGWLTRDEWKWSDGSFYRMDTNSDNRLSRYEFQTGLANTANRIQNDDQVVNPDGQFNNGQWNNRQSVQRNRAMQAGYDRGLSEGRQAGREDYANGHGWDLDGQTELERADSGYYSQLGALGDYQGGYREGFRAGYPEGFAQR
jgi:Ca2+-binding EF-hand superfamily protein